VNGCQRVADNDQSDICLLSHGLRSHFLLSSRRVRCAVCIVGSSPKHEPLTRRAAKRLEECDACTHSAGCQAEGQLG
jgi:hypothetical protein